MEHITINYCNPLSIFCRESDVNQAHRAGFPCALIYATSGEDFVRAIKDNVEKFPYSSPNLSSLIARVPKEWEKQMNCQALKDLFNLRFIFV